MEANFIFDMDQITAQDLPLVGGKGANLGELSHAGFPVPPGFCVSTAGFDAFLHDALEMPAYYERLAQLAADDVEGVRQVGARLRSYLGSVPVPEFLAEAILQAWRRQGADTACAVRSSATAEDLPTASFAGQQDTFLNVRGEKALLDSVRACWVSLFTDRAILYRAQNGFDHRQVKLSVVVQKMVFPEVSGIVFTADPVSGHRQIVSIDASYGLGEALVAGLVSADLYKVDKRNWRLVETQIADKKLAILPDQNGGTYREDLEDDLRHRQVLDEGQAVELARISARIEAHYAAPQDIEWALVDGQFTILQTRPITSLYPVPPADEEFRVFFSFSHAQVMTDVMSPMGLSVWKLMMPFGRPDEAIGYNRHLHGLAGRMYMDVSPVLNTGPGRKLIPRFLIAADELSGNAMRTLVARKDFLDRTMRSKNRATLHGVMHWIRPLIPQAIQRLWFSDPDKAVPLVSAHIQAKVEAARERLMRAEPGLPRLREGYAFTSQAFVKSAKELIPFIMVVMMSKILLDRLVDGFAKPSDLNAVYSGLEGNVTTNMDLEVGDLADVARRHPAVYRLLQENHGNDTLSKLAEVGGGEAFKAALESFLRKYGVRGPSEIDIARPRWKHAPASLFRMVVGAVGHAEAGAHRSYHRQLVADGWAAGKRLEESVRKGFLGPIRARLVRRLVRVFRTHMAIREHPKFMLIQMFDIVRNILCESGEQLVKEGRLGHAEDVWMLEYHELMEALEDPEADLHGLVAERRVEQRHYAGLVPPRVFTSDGEVIRAQYDRSNLPEGAIPGSSVSGGVVEGIARVVVDPTQEVLNPGEILIAPFTDPGWTPLFINAAGLVMEVGGLMTHGSVIAREYGIPAVVGVVDATRLIRTGQRIRVQGDGGYIELLD